MVMKDEDDYMVKMLDLDGINLGENNEVTEEAFRFKLICSYPLSMVNNQDLSSFYARGSSRKEAINSNEKLMIFLHHQDDLYSWVESSEDNPNSHKQF